MLGVAGLVWEGWWLLASRESGHVFGWGAVAVWSLRLAQIDPTGGGPRHIHTTS